jgi:hypothetical protein
MYYTLTARYFMNPIKFQYIPPSGKWHRLFEAQRLLNISAQIIELDRLEPIVDLADAQTIIAEIKAAL